MIVNKVKILLIAFGMLHSSTIAQTNELGLFLGGSMFHGDVGYIHAENALRDSRLSFGLHFKRNFNYHFGVQIGFNHGELYANDNKSYDTFHLDRNLNFKSNILEFSMLLEFNFRPYLSRDSDYNHTPFIFSGMSRFSFNPQALHSDGNWYNLQSLATEGQGNEFYKGQNPYKLNGISIPVGIGYKINVYEFITLAFSVSWRMTFTDYIDDVSTTYVEESILSELGQSLANQSFSDFPAQFQRGNPYTNDKYGFWGVTIVYSIKDRNKGCNNIIY